MGYVTYGSYEKDERVRNKVSFQIAKPKNPRDQSQSEKKMFVFKYIWWSQAWTHQEYP